MDFTHRHIITALALIVYLFLPAQGVVHACVQNTAIQDSRTTYTTAPDSPCDECPCSGEQDSDCCDTTSCPCSCHTPLTRHMHTYAPIVIVQRFAEPHWSLPQVYLSIFVPPQNHA